MRTLAIDAHTITEVVAIDGPAGAGKSTVARRVAATLGIGYLDTGAMYRAATWWALRQGVDLDDPAAVAASTRRMRLEMPEADGDPRVVVDGEDVTEAIRSLEVTRVIYKLDENPAVRAHLVELQREWAAARRPIVAEGRDMGTVVFPEAKCKVYMDAAPEERARRRAAELRAKGVSADLATVREEMRARDAKALSRAVAPLRKAPEAVVIATTAMTLDQVVAAVAKLARAAL